jgi:RNA polymerase sigma factor (sigma-70 family)
MTQPAGELSIIELSQRCQQESKEYRSNRPHNEAYCLELFRRAIVNHNQAAWEAIYEQYQLLVINWVRQHNRFEQINEEVMYLANATFARFWRTISKQQESFEIDTLGKLLNYLKRCVYSSIEDIYRQQQRRPSQVIIENELSEARVDDTMSPEVRIVHQLEIDALAWAILRRLQGEAEMVVARLSWVEGLSPREIQARKPDLFSKVERVYQVKRNILTRLQRDPEIQKLWRQMR